MVSRGNVGGASTIGLEIAESGTRLATYVETPDGSRLLHQRLERPASPAETLPLLGDLIRRTVSDLVPSSLGSQRPQPPLRIGIAFWGRVDRDQQRVLQLRQNAGWSGFPLARALTEALSGTGPNTTEAVSLTLETAVNASAWHEYSHGGLSPISITLLYIHLGREVSAAVIKNGQFLIRHSETEEQFGHSTVTDSRFVCRCGGYGHLASVASAQSLVRLMIGRASDDDTSLGAILALTKGRAEALTAAQVITLAADGDAIAGNIVAQALDALALAIANAALLLSPQVVVIGGSVAECGETFLAPLRERLVRLLNNTVPLPEVRRSLPGHSASLQGAHDLVSMTHVTTP